jgi:hypothetical protein
MPYFAIMNVEANRVAKYAHFETQEEAAAHIAAHPEWPNAFIVDGGTVNGPVPEWWVVDQVVTVVPVPPTPAQQQAEIDAAQRSAIKVDSFVGNFIAMTPAQVSNYIETNVTNLASAKAVIEKLAIMVLLLARREFR